MALAFMDDKVAEAEVVNGAAAVVAAERAPFASQDAGQLSFADNGAEPASAEAVRESVVWYRSRWCSKRHFSHESRRRGREGAEWR